MANAYPTIVDIANVTGEGGKFLKPVRLLTQKHPFLKMLPMIECNKTDSHEFSSDFVLPDPSYRDYNQGIEATNGGEGKTEEKTTQISDRMAVDQDEAELNGNKEQFLTNKAMQHMEGMWQAVETGLFYNNLNANPNRFNGLTPRLNALNHQWARQLVKHASSSSGSDQASVWLAVLGEESVAMLYPRGTTAGLRSIELPVPTLVNDTNSKQFRAIVQDWTWRFGLQVKDARQVSRGHGLDTSATLATDFDIIPMLTKMMHRIENLAAGTPVFMMNRFVMELMDLQCQNNSRQVALERYVEGEAGPRRSFRGIDIFITDALTITEDAVA